MPLSGQPTALLQTTTDPVDVSVAAAPSLGQVLTATGGTTATWQNIAGGGGNPAVSTTQGAGAVTTTSAVDVAFTTPLNLTPGAGNYLIMFSCQHQSSSNSGVNTFSIYINGILVAISARADRVAASGNNQALSLQTYVTGVLAGQVIEVRWKTSTGTATCSNRELTLIKTA